jgi:hypothetical protein
MKKRSWFDRFIVRAYHEVIGEIQTRFLPCAWCGKRIGLLRYGWDECQCDPLHRKCIAPYCAEHLGEPVEGLDLP